MTRKTDPIRKVTLKSGEVRYEVVIDGELGRDGRRTQRRLRFPTKKEAQAARAEMISSRAKGTYVTPTKLTVGEYLPRWLAGKRNLKPTTRRCYQDALAHVEARLGTVELQKLTKGHLDGLVDHMLAEGRRIGNVQRQTLTARTVNLTLTVLHGALKSALREGLVARNVAELVERPGQVRREMHTWTAEQAQAFLASVAGSRLEAAWLLTMYGLRRGEVLGLRWADVDLDARTVTVCQNRVMVAGQIVTTDPKSQRSRRTLPMDKELIAALTALKITQHAEREAAGAAYKGSGLVVCDEAGHGYRPEWYGDTFTRLARSASLPVIRLHDARHTCGTLMHLRGVPVAVISAWLGHASSAFTMATYVHSQHEALMAAGQTLAGALGGVVTSA